MDHGLETLHGNVSGAILRKIYMNEYKKPNRLLPKLTEIHFNYDTFQKMRVYLATQILSNSCAKAIQEMLKKDFFTKQQIPVAEATAIFCKNMNDFFDLMNSKDLNDKNLLKRGLSNNTIDKLRSLKEYIYSFNQNKGSTVFCLNGMKLTINSVINYFEENSHDKQIVILTRLLNQDPLENAFGEIRKQTHNSTNPYLLDYLRILSRIVTTKYDLANENRNVEWDASHKLSLIDLNQFFKNKEKKLKMEDTQSKMEEIEIWEDLDCDSDVDMDNELHEVCIERVFMVTGFL